MISAELQVANAVAVERLRLAAELIAAGCPTECITWMDPGYGRGPNCGLLVCGFLACEVHVEWNRSGPAPAATITSWWCGEGATARTWVPSKFVLEYWGERGGYERPAWAGPNL